MCLNPVRIRNKGFYRLGGMPYVEVGCGQCSECADTKQIDYFVRAWSLYRSLPSSWSVWFSTLTFNEENCPRSRVMVRQGQQYVETGTTRCFDHRILSRFLKSYRQYFRRDLGLSTPHVLVTSEFGENFHRPHYHAIFFVPKCYVNWESFRDELARFWHYGYTKNIAVKRVDEIDSERSASNCFKYVTKYALKGTSVMPYYLNHGDDVILGDLAPCYYTPRVFTTNGFGSALEAILTDANYRDNKIVLSIDGKYKPFNLPAYYRRRYYTGERIIKQEVEYKSTFWNPHKRCVRRVTETYYKHDYEALRDEAVQKHARIEYGLLGVMQQFISREDFVKYRLLDYNSNTEHRYVYKWMPLNYDPLNSDGITLSSIYGDKPLQFHKFFITLSPDESTFLNYEKVSKTGVTFTRHSDFCVYLVSKYGRDIVSRLHDMDCKLSNIYYAEIDRRSRNKEAERISNESFYEAHHIRKFV